MSLVLPVHYRRKIRRAIPGAPRIEFAPARPLWRGRSPIISGAAGLRIQFETAICDANGRVERVLQRGRNTITNWGMDQLASQAVATLINTLVLSSTQDGRKRVLSGPTLTVTYTSPTNIGVTSSTSWFVASDAGRTLKLPNVPELKITTYTSGTAVTCATPSGDWLPGFTPPGSPTNYTQATVYFTDLSTLATYFTQFNSYDTSATDYQSELNDDANSRFNHQRIFLSAAVTGADWTVNQLGWSDGNGTHNCFGVANLTSPDVIPVGKKYRVKLNAYSGYTLIDLVGVSINWGATIGTYTMDLRQCYVGRDTLGGSNWYGSACEPCRLTSAASTWTAHYRTDAYTMQTVHWQNAGNDITNQSASWVDTGQAVVLGAYTNGTFKRTKNVKWPDSLAITNATALGIVPEIPGGRVPILVFRPQSGTVTKPTGYWCDWTFPVYWTRDLPT